MLFDEQYVQDHLLLILVAFQEMLERFYLNLHHDQQHKMRLY